MYSDEQLVKQSLKGDNQAFDELVLRYQNKIYHLCYRYMGNPEDANDMAQETFIKAFRALRSFRGNASFGTWLHRICNNVCLDELRRRKRRIVPFSLDEPLNDEEGRLVERVFSDDSLAGDKVYEQKELAQYIQTLLDDMKYEQKSALILRDIMGYNYEEIATILNCSLGTVKSRINRGRQSLKNKLEEGELFP